MLNVKKTPLAGINWSWLKWLRFVSLWKIMMFFRNAARYGQKDDLNYFDGDFWKRASLTLVFAFPNKKKHDPHVQVSFFTVGISKTLALKTLALFGSHLTFIRKLQLWFICFNQRTLEPLKNICFCQFLQSGDLPVLLHRLTLTKCSETQPLLYYNTCSLCTSNNIKYLYMNINMSIHIHVCTFVSGRTTYLNLKAHSLGNWWGPAKMSSFPKKKWFPSETHVRIRVSFGRLSYIDGPFCL